MRPIGKRRPPRCSLRARPPAGLVSVPVGSDISGYYLARWRGCSCLIKRF